MPGTFQNPPPGQKTDEPYDKEHLHIGEKVIDLEHPTARKNFRVVVIKPEVVEAIDLNDPAKSRRRVYTYNTSTGQWDSEERWP